MKRVAGPRQLVGAGVPRHVRLKLAKREVERVAVLVPDYLVERKLEKIACIE